MQRKHFRLFLALVAISVTLMMYQSRLGPVRPLWFLSLALDNLNTSITDARDFWQSTVKKMTLRESELKELRQEVNRLRLREIRYQDIAEENRHLRDVLDLKTQYTPREIMADVIAQGSDRFASTLVINKGTDDGIEKDMPVITPLGLLGKVYSTNALSSVVMLIDDTRFSVAVRLREERTEGILSGDGQGRCVLKYVATDRPVTRGEILLTSGLDKLFPKGIPAGTVTEVTTPQKELFHIIKAAPIVDLRKVEEVVILAK